MTPPVTYASTTLGTALNAANITFQAASFTQANLAGFADQVKTIVLALGNSHLSSLARAAKGVNATRAFLSNFNAVDANYKRRYETLKAAVAQRQAGGPVLGQFKNIEADMKKVTDLARKLVDQGRNLETNLTSANKAFGDFRVRSNDEISRLSGLHHEYGFNLTSQASSFHTDTATLISNRLNLVNADFNPFKGQVGSVTTAMATGIAQAVAPVLSAILAARASNNTANTNELNTQKATLTTDRVAMNTKLGEERTADLKILSDFLSSTQTKYAADVTSAASVYATTFPTIKNAVGSFRTMVNALPAVRNFLDYGQKGFEWAASKADFDNMNLNNFMTAYRTQINQILLNYEALGLTTGIVTRMLSQAPSTHLQTVVSATFRPHEWTSVTIDKFPGTLTTETPAEWKVYRFLLREFDTDFTAATVTYRAGCKMFDRSYDFQALGAVALVTAAAGSADPSGAFAFVAVTDEMAANEQIVCSLQLALGTGLADLPAAPAAPAASTVSPPNLYTLTFTSAPAAPAGAGAGAGTGAP